MAPGVLKVQPMGGPVELSLTDSGCELQVWRLWRRLGRGRESPSPQPIPRLEPVLGASAVRVSEAGSAPNVHGQYFFLAFSKVPRGCELVSGKGTLPHLSGFLGTFSEDPSLRG